MFVFIISLVNALDSFTIVTQTNVISSKDVRFRSPFPRVPNVAIRLKEPSSVYAEIHSISSLGFTVSVLTDESHLLHYEYFASLDHEIQCHSGVNGVVNVSQPYTLFHMTHNLLFITDTILARGEYGFCVIKPPISENLILAQQSIELDSKGSNSLDLDATIQRSVEVDSKMKSSLEVDQKIDKSVEVDSVNHQSIGIINHDSLQIDKPIEVDDQQDLQDFKDTLKQQIIQTILHLQRSDDEPINTIDVQKILQAQQQEEQLSMVYDMQHQELDLETDEIATQQDAISYEFDPETQFGEQYDQEQFEREQVMEQKRIQAEQEELALGNQVEELTWGQIQSGSEDFLAEHQLEIQGESQSKQEAQPQTQNEVQSLSDNVTLTSQGDSSETQEHVEIEIEQDQIEELLYNQGFSKPAANLDISDNILGPNENIQDKEPENTNQKSDITDLQTPTVEQIKEPQILEDGDQNKILEPPTEINLETTNFLSNIPQEDRPSQNSNNIVDPISLENQEATDQHKTSIDLAIESLQNSQEDSNILIAQSVLEDQNTQINQVIYDVFTRNTDAPIEIHEEVVYNMDQQSIRKIEDFESEVVMETLVISDPIIVLGDKPELDQFTPQVLDEEQSDSNLIDVSVPDFQIEKEPLSLYIEGLASEPIEQQPLIDFMTDTQNNSENSDLSDLENRSLDIEVDNTIENNNTPEYIDTNSEIGIDPTSIADNPKDIQTLPLPNAEESKEINQEINSLDVPQYEIEDVPRQTQISLSINLKNQPHIRKQRQNKHQSYKQHQQLKVPQKRYHKQIQIPNIIEQWAEQDIDAGVIQDVPIQDVDILDQIEQQSDQVQSISPEPIPMIKNIERNLDQHQKPSEIVKAEKEFQDFKSKIQPISEVQPKVKVQVQPIEPKIEIIDPIEHEKRKQEILEQIKHELQQHRGQSFKQETGQYALENAFTSWLHTERDVISDIFLSHQNVQPENAFVQDREVENIYEQSLEKKVLISENKHPVTFLRYIRDDPLLDDNYSE